MVLYAFLAVRPPSQQTTNAVNEQSSFAFGIILDGFCVGFGQGVLVFHSHLQASCGKAIGSRLLGYPQHAHTFGPTGPGRGALTVGRMVHCCLSLHGYLDRRLL